MCRPYLFCRRCWGTSFAFHLLMLGAILLLVPSASQPEKQPIPPFHAAVSERDDPPVDDETLEETEEVHDREIVAEEPVIKDEEIADHVETDNDMDFEENFGGTEGLSDAPFEGPANNGMIGIGGGGRGAFGRRPLRGGGGGPRGRAIGVEGGAGGGGVTTGGAAPHRGGRATTRRATTTTRTWKRSPLVANSMRLALGTKTTLPLEALHVRATIEGFRARVVLECDYHNHTGRSNVEGTFQWRLPDGATPYYLAFGQLGARASAAPSNPLATDLGSLRSHTARGVAAMKEARIVPRARAAKAYTETVRRRIDPALMEWAGAGIFQTRVFPLQAGQRHRITVGYEINLEPRGDEQVFELPLPEAEGDVVAEIAVREAATHGGATWTTHSFRNPTALPLEVAVPNEDATLLRGGSPETFHSFAAQLTPALPTTCGHAGFSQAVYLLDTSTSSAASFETWLRLLAAHLRTNRDTITSFAVGFFNVEAYWWRPGFTANDEAALEALLAGAGTTVLEGASDLGAAFRMAGAREGQFDIFLLSDGAATWGERDPRVLAARLERAGAALPTGGSPGGRTGRSCRCWRARRTGRSSR